MTCVSLAAGKPHLGHNTRLDSHQNPAQIQQLQ